MTARPTRDQKDRARLEPGAVFYYGKHLRRIIDPVPDVLQQPPIALSRSAPAPRTPVPWGAVVHYGFALDRTLVPTFVYPPLLGLIRGLRVNNQGNYACLAPALSAILIVDEERMSAKVASPARSGL